MASPSTRSNPGTTAMLSVGLVKGAAQAATYFDKDNYYMGGSEGPSQWWGAGAEAAGLSGPVDRRQFEAALNGQLPDGTRLGTEREGKHAHKPGWDLTWLQLTNWPLRYEFCDETRTSVFEGGCSAPRWQ